MQSKERSEKSISNFDINTPLQKGLTVLEASAGTGKTYQLVNIFLRMIAEEGVKIDRILAMTFTVAATAEIKDRLRSRLSGAIISLGDLKEENKISDQLILKWAKAKNREEIRKRLYDALIGFDRAQVFTIHGFCLRMLQSFAFETGLEFGTELVTDASDMVEEILTKFYIERINSLRSDGEDLIKRAVKENLFETLTQSLIKVSDDPDIKILPERPSNNTGNTDYNVWALKMMHDAYDYLIEELKKKKRERRVMTYHDLLVYLREAIEDKERGKRLKDVIGKKFDAILVDEFQDTDVVQWHIFDKLFNDNRHYLFLVGDPKQSIYAFRKADVRAYISAWKKAKANYTIGTNWRSDGKLVKAINHLYSRMNEPFDISDIRYTEIIPANEEDRIKGLPDFIEAPLTFRVPDEKIINDRELNREKTEKLVIRLVASDVVDLLNKGTQILDKGVWREISPKDIAILVKSNQQARLIKDELLMSGVPAVIFSEQSVFDSDAAKYLLYLLKGVLNPSDPACIRSAIATPLFGIRAEEALGLSEDDLSEYTEFMEDLKELWVEKGIAPMINKVLGYKGNLSKIIESTDYERIVTDIRHLTELLQERSVEFAESPEVLYMWFSKRVNGVRGGEDSFGEEEQLRLESDADSVVISTMHKAKGLEFGVVFCPFLWEYKTLSTNETLIRYHEENNNQVCYMFKNFLAKDKENSVLENAKKLYQAEEDQEFLRLAYVAITRGKYRSVVYAFLHTYGKRKKDGSIDIKTSSFFSKIFNAVQKKEDAWKGGWKDVWKKFKEVLRDISERSENLIGVTSISETEDKVYKNNMTIDERKVNLREFPERKFEPFVRTSFSGLLKLGRRDDEPLDLELRRKAELVPGEVSEILLPNFPEGVIGGQCIHEIMSKISFKNYDRQDQEGVVKDILKKWGFEDHFREVNEMIKNVIDYPLESGLTLRNVDDKDRFCEIDFVFSVIPSQKDKYVDAKGLSEILKSEGGDLERDYAERLSELNFSKFTGFLVGKMDLIFRVNDIWYLVDYKTNKLGYRLADYAPERLKDIMMEEHYMLQYLIYYTALHRYLRHRLGANYSPEKSLGGVFYLFVCGMKGNYGKNGVFAVRPSAGLVDALSKFFGIN